MFEKTIQWLMTPSKKQQAQQAPKLPDSVSFEVAGVPYRMKEVIKLASKIKKFDMPAKRLIEIGYQSRNVYRYYFKNEPVELRPEPTNPHDPNAIMVLINNIHVGYVPQTDIQNVNKFLPYAQSISAQITGGEYRVVFSETEEANFSEPVKIIIRLRR